MAEPKEDERFAHILSDSKLQRFKLKEQKTKVDKRFHSLIASSKSKQKCLIDKRGRPLNATSKGGLSRFYDLSDSTEENSDQETIHHKGKKEETLHKKEKDKEEKWEKAKRGKGNIKQNAIYKEKPDDEEQDEEQTDEEEGMELDTEEEDEDENDDKEDDDNDDEDDHSDEEDDDDDEEDEEEDKSSWKRNSKNKKKKDDITPDYSRGIGNISSSSDEEEDDDDQENYGEGPVAAIHPWADTIEKEVPIVDQGTRRLAICNMNWDYVTAQDLMMLCNSFKPQHGTVSSVTIYPTEFGMERMKEEHKKGPKEITEAKESAADCTTENAGNTEAEEKESTIGCTTKKKAKKVNKEKKNANRKDENNSEKVRQYELNRLRYFVAVVECDSIETADQIYTNCDGMEFEKSGTKLDFRYIPDGETFDYEPKSVATSLPASKTYKPPHFVDSALSRTDVKLSWDRTSHRRLAMTQMDFRKVKNIDDLEDQFQEYIAPYMSDVDEEDDEDPYPNLDWSYVPGELPAKKDVQEMKSTLLTLKEEEKAEEEGTEEEERDSEEEEEEPKSDEDHVHMEFTWDLGLKDSLEEAAKQKKKQIENAKLTPWEQYQKNTREKKRQKEREKKRKAKSGQQKEVDKLKENAVELDSFFLPDGSGDEEEEKPKRRKESLKKRAKRRKREAEEQHLEVDQAVLADPRFADLTKKEFALDPSAPEFRKRRRKF